MPAPSVAFAVVARLRKQLPLHKRSAERLFGDVNIALDEAKRADAKSCMSFWARLAPLAREAAELRKPLDACFSDAEILQKHRKDLPDASDVFMQLKRLSDLMDAIQDALERLEKEAKRISNKTGVLWKLKSEIKDKRLEVDFNKKYEAGMSGLGLLVSLILVYKKLAGKKVSLS